MERERLKKILTNHKLWVESNGSEGRKARLRGADLRGEDLRGVNLSGANLSCADLESTTLRGANLSGANLNCVDLWGADLRGANLENADLDSACFQLEWGWLDVHIDDKYATQLLYYLMRNVKFSKNVSPEMKKLFNNEKLIEQANKFHRVDEYGVIEREVKNGKKI